MPSFETNWKQHSLASCWQLFLKRTALPLVLLFKLMKLQDQGLLRTPIHLCGDNKGVFTAVSAQNPKTTAEPTLTPHVKALRELIDSNTITTLVWVDNHDMIANPLTKGKTRRNELNDVLDTGHWIIANPTEHWPKRSSSSTSLS